MQNKNLREKEKTYQVWPGDNGVGVSKWQVANKKYDRAVVIGGGIAGLTAAKVLTKYFSRVTIIERDRQQATPEFRQGVPQARHAHTLMPRGQMVLEKLFPGLTDEMLANGAAAIDQNREIAFYREGKWHTPKPSPSAKSFAASRPMLEYLLYCRLADHPQIRFLQGYEVKGLRVDETAQKVTGVTLRMRGSGRKPEVSFSADLVVDASGRNSRAAEWLADLGYTPPKETTVNAYTGYASRIYRRPAEFSEEWKILYVRPDPASSTRGGVILPMEGDRWHVTLYGMAHDYPPTDEDGFVAFAQSLPTMRLYEAIENAEPLTKPSGYRRTENRLLHFGKLPRYLEGFLVTGDAVYTLNPVYALGMTTAALGSQALDKTLQMQRSQIPDGDLAGLASNFQKRLDKAIAPLLRVTLSEDESWPSTEVIETSITARQTTTERSIHHKTQRRTVHAYAFS